MLIKFNDSNSVIVLSEGCRWGVYSSISGQAVKLPISGKLYLSLFCIK
jgi:hypothetical protein